MKDLNNINKVIIVSDSHDHIENIRKIIEIANKNFDLLIHCGDLCSPFSAKEFLKLKIPMIYVFGNNDAEKRLIENTLSNKVVFDVFAGKINDNSFFIYHGTNFEIVKKAFDSELFDFVIYGHTHQVEIKNNKKTTLINPGELCGYLTGKSTYAILDLENKKVEIKEL